MPFKYDDGVFRPDEENAPTELIDNQKFSRRSKTAKQREWKDLTPEEKNLKYQQHLNTNNLITESTATPSGIQREDYEDYIPGVIDPIAMDIDDIRAHNQTRREKWWRASVKMGATALTTAADGIFGTAAGILNFDGTLDSFVDNPISRQLMDWNKAVEEYLPNYYTKEEEKMSTFQKLGTANFWSDGILKNLGFAIGAYASGAIIGGGVFKALSGGARNRLFKEAGEAMASKMLKGEKAFATLDEEAKWIAAARGGDVDAGTRLLASIKSDAATLKFANKSSQIIGSTLGSFGEARAEAIGAKDEFIDRLTRERAQGLNNYTDEQIEEAAIGVSNATFGLNALFLSASNYIQFRNSFAGGFKINKDLSSRVQGKVGEFTNNFKLGKARTASNFLVSLKNPLTEGGEEFAQAAISSTGVLYGEEKLKNPEGYKNIINQIGGVFSKLPEGIGKNLTQEGFENFLMGAITGVMGVPTIGGKFGVQLAGGIHSDFREAQRLDKKAAETVKFLNDNSTVLKKYMNAYMTDGALDAEKAQAIINNDTFAHENADDKQVFNILHTLAEVGKLDDYLESVQNDYTKFTGQMSKEDMEDFKSLFRSTDVLPDGTKSPGLFDFMSDEDIKQTMAKRAKKMLELGSFINEAKEDINIKFSNASDEFKTEQLYNLFLMDRTQSRINELSKDLAENYGFPLGEEMDNMVTAFSNIAIPEQEKIREKLTELWNLRKERKTIMDNAPQLKDQKDIDAIYRKNIEKIVKEADGDIPVGESLFNDPIKFLTRIKNSKKNKSKKAKLEEALKAVQAELDSKAKNQTSLDNWLANKGKEEYEKAEVEDLQYAKEQKENQDKYDLLEETLKNNAKEAEEANRAFRELLGLPIEEFTNEQRAERANNAIESAYAVIEKLSKLKIDNKEALKAVDKMYEKLEDIKKLTEQRHLRIKSYVENVISLQTKKQQNKKDNIREKYEKASQVLIDALIKERVRLLSKPFTNIVNMNTRQEGYVTGKGTAPNSLLVVYREVVKDPLGKDTIKELPPVEVFITKDTLRTILTKYEFNRLKKLGQAANTQTASTPVANPKYIRTSGIKAYAKGDVYSYTSDKGEVMYFLKTEDNKYFRIDNYKTEEASLRVYVYSFKDVSKMTIEPEGNGKEFVFNGVYGTGQNVNAIVSFNNLDELEREVNSPEYEEIVIEEMEEEKEDSGDISEDEIDAQEEIANEEVEAENEVIATEAEITATEEFNESLEDKFPFGVAGEKFNDKADHIDSLKSNIKFIEKGSGLEELLINILQANFKVQDVNVIINTLNQLAIAKGLKSIKIYVHGDNIRALRNAGFHVVTDKDNKSYITLVKLKPKKEIVSLRLTRPKSKKATTTKKGRKVSRRAKSFVLPLDKVKEVKKTAKGVTYAKYKNRWYVVKYVKRKEDNNSKYGFTYYPKYQISELETTNLAEGVDYVTQIGTKGEVEYYKIGYPTKEESAKAPVVHYPANPEDLKIVEDKGTYYIATYTVDKNKYFVRINKKISALTLNKDAIETNSNTDFVPLDTMSFSGENGELLDKETVLQYAVSMAYNDANDFPSDANDMGDDIGITEVLNLPSVENAFTKVASPLIGEVYNNQGERIDNSISLQEYKIVADVLDGLELKYITDHLINSGIKTLMDFNAVNANILTNKLSYKELSSGKYSLEVKKLSDVVGADLLEKLTAHLTEAEKAMYNTTLVGVLTDGTSYYTLGADNKITKVSTTNLLQDSAKGKLLTFFSLPTSSLSTINGHRKYHFPLNNRGINLTKVYAQFTLAGHPKGSEAFTKISKLMNAVIAEGSILDSAANTITKQLNKKYQEVLADTTITEEEREKRIQDLIAQNKAQREYYKKQKKNLQETQAYKDTLKFYDEIVGAYYATQYKNKVLLKVESGDKVFLPLVSKTKGYSNNGTVERKAEEALPKDADVAVAMNGRVLLKGKVYQGCRNGFIYSHDALGNLIQLTPNKLTAEQVKVVIKLITDLARGFTVTNNRPSLDNPTSTVKVGNNTESILVYRLLKQLVNFSDNNIKSNKREEYNTLKTEERNISLELRKLRDSKSSLDINKFNTLEQDLLSKLEYARRKLDDFYKNPENLKIDNVNYQLFMRFTPGITSPVIVLKGENYPLVIENGTGYDVNPELIAALEKALPEMRVNTSHFKIKNNDAVHELSVDPTTGELVSNGVTSYKEQVKKNAVVKITDEEGVPSHNNQSLIYKLDGVVKEEDTRKEAEDKGERLGNLALFITDAIKDKDNSVEELEDFDALLATTNYTYGVVKDILYALQQRPVVNGLFEDHEDSVILMQYVNNTNLPENLQKKYFYDNMGNPLTDEGLIAKGLYLFYGDLTKALMDYSALKFKKAIIEENFKLKVEDVIDLDDDNSDGFGNPENFRLSSDNLTMEDFSTIDKKIIKRFGNSVVVKIVDKLKHNAQGAILDNLILLSKSATSGTIDHESFEMVWNNFLSDEQKAQILKEAKANKEIMAKYELVKDAYIKIYGSDAAALERVIKEAIAEEFVEYVKSEGTKTYDANPYKNWFFRQLWELFNWIRNLLYNNSNISIQKLFEDIENGTYANQPIVKKTTEESYRITLDRGDGKFNEYIDDVVLFNDVVEGYNTMFLTILTKLYKDPDILFKNPSKVNMTKVIESFKANLKITIDSYKAYLEKAPSNVKPIMERYIKSLEFLQVPEYFKAVQNEHAKRFIQFGIDMLEDQDINEVESTRDETFNNDRNIKINLKRTTSNLVKWVIYTTIEKDPKTNRPLRNSAGMEKTINFSATFAKLFDRLSNTSNPEKQMEILQSMHDVPGIMEIAKRVRMLKDDSQPHTLGSIKALVSFVQSFAKHKYSFLMTVLNKGNNVVIKDVTTDWDENRVLNDWRNNIFDKKVLLHGTQQYDASKLYSFLTNLYEPTFDYNKVYTEKTLSDNQIKMALNNVREPDKAIKILKYFGITYSPSVEEKILAGQVNEFFDIQQSLEFFLTKILKKETALNILNPRLETDEGGFRKRLIYIELKYGIKEKLGSVFNISGNRVSPHGYNCFLTLMTDAINEVNTLDELYKRFPHLDPNVNPFTSSSLILKRGGLIFDENGNKYEDANPLDIAVMFGTREEDTNAGKEFTDISFTDRVAVYFAARNKGYYVLPRPADSKQEKFIYLGPEFAKNKSMAAFRMLEYLKDDIRAAIKIVNGSAKYTNMDYKHGMLLDVLRKKHPVLYQGIINAIENGTLTSEDSINHFITTDEVGMYLDVFNDYLNELGDKHFEKLEEFKLITKDINGYYKSTGLPLPDDFVGNVVPTTMLKQYVRDHMALSFLSKVEAYKTLIGNPIQFKDIEDAIKRVNLPNSPKNVAVVGNVVDEFISTLNSVDGADTLGLDNPYSGFRPTVRTVVVEDTTTTADNWIEYGAVVNAANADYMKAHSAFIKAYEAYKANKSDENKRTVLNEYNNLLAKALKTPIKNYIEMTETDGASKVSLCGLRRFLIRDGAWEDLEDTYQYEMQKYLAFRYITEEGNREKLKERFIDTFGFEPPRTMAEFKSFNPISPSTGKEIRKQDLKSVTALKPQYFGPMAEAEGYMTSYKTAFFIAWPSMAINFDTGEIISDRLLNDINYMADNQVSVIAYRSANKGVTTKLNNDGYVNEVNTFSGDNDYSNVITQDTFAEFWGIQVSTLGGDHHDSVFGSQAAKQIMNGIYEYGKAIDPELATSRDKYLKANNARISIAFNMLEKRLGIIFDPNTNSYKLKDNDFKRFAEDLKKEAIKRDLNDAIIDSIDLIAQGFGVETTLDPTSISNILMAICEKSSIKRPVNGTPSFQVPADIIDGKRKPFAVDDELGISLQHTPNGKPIFGSSKLSAYKSINKDGKEVITSMEVYIPAIYEEMYSIEDFKNNPELLKLIGFRIPTQGLNSIENIIVKGFLPKHYGNIVIVPSEIVGKAGSDFDIDKLYLYFPNVFKNVDGKYIYIKDGEGQFDEYLTSVEKEYKKLANTIELPIQDWEQLKEALLTDNMDVLDEIRDTITNDVKKFIKLNKEINISSREEEKILLDATSSLKKFINSLYSKSEFQIAQSENTIQEAFHEILSHPKSYYQLVNPIENTSVKELRTMLNGIFKIDSRDKKDYSKLGEEDYMHGATTQNFEGAGVIGIVALASTFHILAQQNDFYVALDTITDKEYGKPNKFSTHINFKHNKTKDGRIALGGLKDTGYTENHNTTVKFISEVFSELLSCGVDNAKDPILGDTNLGLRTISTALYLVMAGVPIKTVGLFMNQPSIRQYIKNQIIYESGTAEVNDTKKYKFGNEYNEGIILTSLKELSIVTDEVTIKAKLADTKTRETEISNEELIKSLKDYNDTNLVDTEFQTNILLDFIRYQEAAKKLGSAIQATTYDTNGFGGTPVETIDKLQATELVIDEGFIGNFENAITKESEFLTPYYDITKRVANFLVPTSIILNHPVSKEAVTGFITNLRKYTAVGKDRRLKIINSWVNSVLTVGMLDIIDQMDNAIDSLFMNPQDSLSTRIRTLQRIKNSTNVTETELPLKKLIQNNVLLDRLRIVDRTPDFPFDTFYIDTKGIRESFEENEIIKSWESLLQNSTIFSTFDRSLSKYSNFGMDLIKAFLIQNGLIGSPISVHRLIPPTVYSNLIKKAFYALNDENLLNNKDALLRAHAYFLLINSNNRDIVPFTGKNTSGNKLVTVTKQFTLKPGISKEQADSLKAKGISVYNPVPTLSTSKGVLKAAPIYNNFYEKKTLIGVGATKAEENVKTIIEAMTDSPFIADLKRRNKKGVDTTKGYWEGDLNNFAANQVLVFGSNPEGRHGLGAATLATKLGAYRGKAKGFMGQSYGLITKNISEKVPYTSSETGRTYEISSTGKNRKAISVPREQIISDIKELYIDALKYPNKQFIVVYKANANMEFNKNDRSYLNNYTPYEMASMFAEASLQDKGIPSNIIFEKNFKNAVEVAKETMEAAKLLEDSSFDDTAMKECKGN